MSYEIVSSVVFALILFRIIEDGIDYVAEKLLERKRSKDFKKLLANLEDSLPFSKPFNLEIGCDDECCDICNDDEDFTIPVVKKKPVKKTVKKAATKRPVKKTAAKKKTTKKK